MFWDDYGKMGMPEHEPNQDFNGSTLNPLVPLKWKETQWLEPATTSSVGSFEMFPFKWVTFRFFAFLMFSCRCFLEMLRNLLQVFCLFSLCCFSFNFLPILNQHENNHFGNISFRFFPTTKNQQIQGFYVLVFRGGYLGCRKPFIN